MSIYEKVFDRMGARKDRLIGWFVLKNKGLDRILTIKYVLACSRGRLKC